MKTFKDFIFPIIVILLLLSDIPFFVGLALITVYIFTFFGVIVVIAGAFTIMNVPYEGRYVTPVVINYPKRVLGIITAFTIGYLTYLTGHEFIGYTFAMVPVITFFYALVLKRNRFF